MEIGQGRSQGEVVSTIYKQTDGPAVTPASGRTAIAQAMAGAPGIINEPRFTVTCMHCPSAAKWLTLSQQNRVHPLCDEHARTTQDVDSILLDRGAIVAVAMTDSYRCAFVEARALRLLQGGQPILPRAPTAAETVAVLTDALADELSDNCRTDDRRAGEDARAKLMTNRRRRPKVKW